MVREQEKVQVFQAPLLPPGLPVPLQGVRPAMRGHTPTPEPTRRSGAEEFHKRRYLWGSAES